MREMNDFLPITIRIMHNIRSKLYDETSEINATGINATEWTVYNSDELTFKSSLFAICQVLRTDSATAFEYEDEDGDLITVRSDEEMNAMLSFYQYCIISKNTSTKQPLIIYPKIAKQAVKRNRCDLKVDTRTSPTFELMELDGSRKKSGNLDEILACGTIKDTDLNYIGILGSGNCGSVYKAFHITSERYTAVKVIPLDITKDVQQQIISELDVLHQCKSIFIISFYGAFFLENKISICTEYMDGGSLDQYKYIPEDILGPISVSVVQGLQYLWNLKIMHRDVKPSNILVNSEGQVKLCDFGISIQLVDSIAKTFIGTNAYMAPERIQGYEYSIHSDVWSLGVSLFELAAGFFPYKSAIISESKSIDLWKSIVNKDPPKLSCDQFSPDFVDLVSQCMQKDLNLRPDPETLMRHPFAQTHVDYNLAVLSDFVTNHLKKK